ncbi:MAG: SRPBCC domain-containing protein [Thermomicrobiales bacterium]
MFTSRINQKGQITIPAPIRDRLGLKPGDRVRFILEDGGVRIERMESFLRDSYQSVPALDPPRTWQEIEEIAHEEHALHVAREGLDDQDISMTDANAAAGTRTSRVIRASREALYRAFTDPAALAVWQAPGEMTGKVHNFDARVGGGYQMSLFYPASEQEFRGKTAEREDRFTARFVELTPPSRIVQAITFDSENPAFAGEMTMTVTFEEGNGGTDVTIMFDHIPSGIRPEDNDAGTRSSLEKLARYVE